MRIKPTRYYTQIMDQIGRIFVLADFLIRRVANQEVATYYKLKRFRQIEQRLDFCKRFLSAYIKKMIDDFCS